MEKFRLPIIKPEKAESSKKSVEAPEKTPEKPFKAFLKQRYPLSEQGEELKRRIQRAIDEGDASELEDCRKLVPTVEHPRMELFEDFQLPKEELESVLFKDLENVQVSKGCRHQCSFCAVEAGAKIEMMPFAAVLKIAEVHNSYADEKLQAWRDWASVIEAKGGKKVEDQWYGISRDQKEVLKKEFQHFSGRDILAVSDRKHGVTYPESWEFDVKRQIENYYDSDPFDYRDSSFPHEDGTPADYGDVFNALATEVAPIHVTTAGWPMADKTAQRAAEKIVAACVKNPKLLSIPRISVNKYEATARRDFKKYLRDMKNVIQTLHPIQPVILFYFEKNNPEDAEFIENVVEPLREFMREIPGRTLQSTDYGIKISRYSGPMADPSKQDDHHDIAACMSGVHIWPDGTIARQAEKQWVEIKEEPGSTEMLSRVKEFVVPKGSRPTSTGEKLFVAQGKKKPQTRTQMSAGSAESDLAA